MMVRSKSARWRRFGQVLILCVAGCLVAPRVGRAGADSPAAQTITLSISSSIGTGNDLYGRLIARHLGRFLPGRPNIVPENMPGAGGVVQANWVANVAKKDGSALAIMQSGPAFDPLLGYGNVRYDPRQFHWLLSVDSLVSLAVVRDDAPLRTPEDLMTKPVIFGGSTGDSVILPSLLNDLLGAKIHLVKGYPGAADVILAMQRGEVQGLSTYWDTVKAIRQGPGTGGGIRILMQITLQKHPELQNVPLVMDYVKDPINRQVMELVLARQAVGRPIVLPPGTPADIVSRFQTAVDQMVVDPEFLAEAAKMRLEINVTSGAELTRLIDQAYKTPETVVKKTAVELKSIGGL
jgi:tripartite-type tricarboxylate transporter receptor subunit TctC